MVHLRKFTIHDSENYRRLSTSSGDIAQWVPDLVENSPISNANLVREFVEADFATEYDFIICSKIGTPVGAICASQEPVFNALNVSYFIGAGYRRLGYMKQALNIFINYCRESTPYDSLFFDVLPGNKASSNLIENFGAKNIGRFCELVYFERYELVLK